MFKLAKSANTLCYMFIKILTQQDTNINKAWAGVLKRFFFQSPKLALKILATLKKACDPPNVKIPC